MTEQMKDLSELGWRKSSWSENDGCVEVAGRVRTVMVRDSHNPNGGALVIAVPQWRVLLRRLRDA
ncbi:DUF397 domain-containing protein [Actinomadura atramentaria]|uniref:DUF397 domain-containing protein n=1 Tax=Actinomadura atramentaria TaxID=1990 RepID=UPI00037B7C92|nr:DUF397 domain-containing protein [Actinomadura atramentaria]